MNVRFCGRWTAATGLALVMTLARGAAAAEPETPFEEEFGQRGIWVISADHGLAWDTGSSFTFYVRRTGDTTSSFLRLQPSLDYFVLDHLSVGFTVGLSYLTQSTQAGVGTGTAVQFGGRLGGSVPIITGVSTLWPKVSAVVSYGSGGHRLFGLQGYLAVAIHSMGHFLVAFGPAYERITDSTDGADGPRSTVTTAFGVLVTLGGWFRR